MGTARASVPGLTDGRGEWAGVPTACRSTTTDTTSDNRSLLECTERYIVWLQRMDSLPGAKFGDDVAANHMLEMCKTPGRDDAPAELLATSSPVATVYAKRVG